MIVHSGNRRNWGEQEHVFWLWFNQGHLGSMHRIMKEVAVDGRLYAPNQPMENTPDMVSL